ncbi:MAG TPA: cytochrome C oxidase subunit IV family protein [Myxococcales bacterium]|nr:cytochrome C oxidase subunit IV family protein [Myxococcales bacterium]
MAEAAPVSHRREYLAIFFVLFVLTVLEVGVAYVHGHKHQVVAALFGLALVKASCVALFFMHLKWETRVLRAIVVIPLALPVMYATVLIAEAIWRRLA